jgi:hypothetical protein
MFVLFVFQVRIEHSVPSSVAVSLSLLAVLRRLTAIVPACVTALEFLLINYTTSISR